MSIRQTLMIACVAALCGCATAGAGGQAKPPPLPESSQAAPAAQNTFTLIRVSDSKWELYVENTNYARFINNFSWAAPAGLTVRSISNIQGGQCTLSENVLKCSAAIAPASCYTCAGGGMTIDFRGDGFDRKFVNTSSGGYYIAYGWQPGVLKVTKTSTFGDVPPCKKGQVSTKANPCAST